MFFADIDIPTWYYIIKQNKKHVIKSVNIGICNNVVLEQSPLSKSQTDVEASASHFPSPIIEVSAIAQ